MSSFRVCLCIFFCCGGAATAARQAPVHAVILRSPQLEVTLDRNDALPYEYRLLSNQAIIRGENSGRAITAAVFRSDPREFATVTVKPRAVKAATSRADFLFTAQLAGHRPLPRSRSVTSCRGRRYSFRSRTSKRSRAFN
jgi:hypothetical protein